MQNVGFGGNEKHNSIASLILNGYQVNSVYKNSFNIDSFTAYDKYLEKNFDTLLGSGRDLYRVLNRVNNGSMIVRNFNYLSGFTDLIQHIGICTKDIDKQNIALKFIKDILSLDCQQKIADINMFSVLNKSIYTSGEFALMEKSLLNPIKTFSAFLTDDKLTEIKTLCKNIIDGNAEDTKILNSYLV